MKLLSATEARRNFFSLLDSAVQGEAIRIERKGVFLRLVRDKIRKGKAGQKTEDYRRHIRGSLDHADQWSWDWDPERGLRLKS